MFGLGSSTYENVEDVVVVDADSVTLVDPEDVFVEPGAVRGEIRVVEVGDVYVQGRDAEFPDPYRDCVVDGGDDVTVTSCQDALVTRGSVGGDLVVERTPDDVFTKQADGLVAEDVEDVRFEGGVDRSADVHVDGAGDVLFSPGSVAAPVTADDVEDVLQASGEAVSGGVTEGTPDRRAPVHVAAAADLLVADGAIDGPVTVADPQDVVTDADL